MGWLHDLLDGRLKKLGLLMLNPEKPSLTADIIREMARSKLVLLAALYLILFYLAGTVAVFAGLFDLPITLYSYEEIDYNSVRMGPSLEHWFGTDLIGRDMFTRILFSIGTSVELSLLVILFGGLLIGVTLGLIAGYYGGWRDSVIMRVGEIFASMPAFFMFLFITVSIRPRYEEIFYSLGAFGGWMLREGIVDFSLILFVFSLFYWVGSARVIRSQTLSLRAMPYVDAARALGSSHPRIIRRHVFPNLLPIVVWWAFLALSSVVVLDVGLAYLGLGIRAPHPSFGSMIAEVNSTRLLKPYPHLLFFPSTIVILFIFAVTILEMHMNRIISGLYTKGGERE